MDNQKTVLIVEDEKNIVDILRFNLQRTTTPARPMTAPPVWRRPAQKIRT